MHYEWVLPTFRYRPLGSTVRYDSELSLPVSTFPLPCALGGTGTTPLSEGHRPSRRILPFFSEAVQTLSPERDPFQLLCLLFFLTTIVLY